MNFGYVTWPTFYFILFFVFLGLHLRHTEVPRLGVKPELHLPAYATATATPDLSHILDPHHSSWQYRIPNPLSTARDRTHILMNISRIHFHCGAMGVPLLFILFFGFLGLCPQHVEVPRLGVESELQLLAYTTAKAMWDPSCVCNLYHSSRQCQIPDPLSEARDQTHNLMDTSQIRFHCTTMGTSKMMFLIKEKAKQSGGEPSEGESGLRQGRIRV